MERAQDKFLCTFYVTGDYISFYPCKSRQVLPYTIQAKTRVAHMNSKQTGSTCIKYSQSTSQQRSGKVNTTRIIK